MEKKPSLEHTRLLILDKIENHKDFIAHLKLCEDAESTLAIYQQELAGHEQALKVLDSHYALLEALKDMVKVFGGNSPRHNAKAMSMERSKDLIKQCEG